MLWNRQLHGLHRPWPLPLPPEHGPLLPLLHPQVVLLSFPSATEVQRFLANAAAPDAAPTLFMMLGVGCSPMGQPWSDNSLVIMTSSSDPKAAPPSDAPVTYYPKECYMPVAAAPPSPPGPPRPPVVFSAEVQCALVVQLQKFSGEALPPDACEAFISLAAAMYMKVGVFL